MKIPLFDALVWVLMSFVIGMALGKCPIDKANKSVESIEKETHAP